MGIKKKKKKRPKVDFSRRMWHGNSQNGHVPKFLLTFEEWVKG